MLDIEYIKYRVILRTPVLKNIWEWLLLNKENLFFQFQEASRISQNSGVYLLHKKNN